MSDIFDKFPNAPVIVAVAPKGMAFCWSKKGVGFGEIFLSLKDGVVDKESGCPHGKLLIDSEAMSKEFVKKIICQAIDEGELT